MQYQETVKVKVGKRIFTGLVIGTKLDFPVIAVNLPIVGAEASISHTFEVSPSTLVKCQTEDKPILLK